MWRATTWAALVLGALGASARGAGAVVVHGRARAARGRGTPIEKSEVFEPSTSKEGPPKKVSFCEQDPCTVEDVPSCCCWTSAAVEMHPSHPNPSEVAAQKTCKTSPELDAAGWAMFKEPGGGAGDLGILASIEATNPIYDNRDLCCALEKDDPRVVSRESATKFAKPMPPSTTWKPRPRPPTTPRPTGDPFKAQDELAESLENSAKKYTVAAMAIKETASDLQDVLDKVSEKRAAAMEKKKVNEKIKRLVMGYARQADAAADGLDTLAKQGARDFRDAAAAEPPGAPAAAPAPAPAR